MTWDTRGEKKTEKILKIKLYAVYTILLTYIIMHMDADVWAQTVIITIIIISPDVYTT